MKNIILQNGNIIDLYTWQDQQNLPNENITNEIKLKDSNVWDNFEISVYVLQILTILHGKGFKTINTLYRTNDHQKDLLKTNPNAAKISPHCFGMAADIDAKNQEETLELAKIIEDIAKLMDIKVRIGFNQYLLNGNTFVHFDVCPEYYGEGKPYHNNNHPKQWEKEIQW